MTTQAELSTHFLNGSAVMESPSNYSRCQSTANDNSPINFCLESDSAYSLITHWRLSWVSVAGNDFVFEICKVEDDGFFLIYCDLTELNLTLI